MNITSQVKLYLINSQNKFSAGQPEYYARIALQQALEAFEENNYGIGAVAIEVTPTTIFEYSAKNAMVTGIGVVDHAETRALIKLKGGQPPDRQYPRNQNQWTMKLPIGISVFGTLEPCPMCSCTITNVGAKLSVSTVRDGDLITTAEGYKISDGGANVVTYRGNQGGENNKFKIQPVIWQWIQNQHQLKFEILDTSDTELVELSLKIFTETRSQIDAELAKRGLFTYRAKRAEGLRVHQHHC